MILRSCAVAALALLLSASVRAEDGGVSEVVGPMGTIITLYNSPFFTSIPVDAPPLRFRGPPPSGPCTALPDAAAGLVGSVEIEWNTAPPQGFDRNEAMCGQVQFWTGPECQGESIGWELEGTASVDKYNYAPTKIEVFPADYVNVHSVSCSKYAPNACSDFECGDNQQCVVKQGSAACVCHTGLVMEHGHCIDPCSRVECPPSSHCDSSKGSAECVCDTPGHAFKDGVCQDPCAGLCPAGASCEVKHGKAECTCPLGHKLKDGACVDPCAEASCPGTSTCSSKHGVPRCVCPRGLSISLAGCISKGRSIKQEFLNAHNEARVAVGSPPLKWDDELADKAAEWVAELGKGSKCHLSHSLDVLHGSADGSLAYGQNLASLCCKKNFYPRHGVELWLREGRHYTPAVFSTSGSAGCASDDWRDCGHYTQAVWSSTSHVGCAMAPCGVEGWTAWVCNYSPAGNLEGVVPY